MKNIWYKWYSWKFSNEFWALVRPAVKIYQKHNEEHGFSYTVSGCYDKVQVSMYLTKQEYKMWNSILLDMSKTVEDIERKAKEEVLA